MKNFKEFKNGLNYILSLENKTFRSKVYTQAVVKSHSVESVEKEKPEISAIEYLHLESFLAEKTQNPHIIRRAATKFSERYILHLLMIRIIILLIRRKGLPYGFGRGVFAEPV